MVKMENGDIIINRGSEVLINVDLVGENDEPYELADNEELRINIFNSDNVRGCFKCKNGIAKIESQITNFLTGFYYFSVSIVNTETKSINVVYQPHRFIVLD